MKEDKELDAIFPLLLMAKGFRILATPVHAKGQSQYGKDIVAIGKEEDIVYRYYFELKGGADRHVDSKTFYNDDGIRMSLLEAKDTSFKDVGVPLFTSLPIKYVLVHNGEIKENIRQAFDGFVSQTFPDGNFERWDLHWLVEQFDLYLFNEYLIPNEEDSRLFRRVLLLIDTPDYNLHDFKALVTNILHRLPNPEQGRQFKSAWATLQLLGQVVWHKCSQNDNLYPAIDALSFLLLSSWAWVLRNKMEEKRKVVEVFRPLVKLHFDFLRDYFGKTSKVAALPNGLFSEGSGLFEKIGYPLRSFDYLGLLIYYYEASYYYPSFNGTFDIRRKSHLEYWHKKYLFKLINSNSSCHRPILDAHSIPILAFIQYIIKSHTHNTSDSKYILNYIINTIASVRMIRDLSGRYPSLSLRLDSLIEYAATGVRPFNYSDSSSLLVPMLFEVLAFFDAGNVWSFVKPVFESDDLNMQVAYPLIEEYDIEQLLFEKHLNEEFYVETGIEFPATPVEYIQRLDLKENIQIKYRTDKVGFPYLRMLAHLYHKTEFFPADWRTLFSI